MSEGDQKRTPTLTPGQFIDGFHILQPLASAGISEAYAASHEWMDGRFVIKALRRDLIGSPSAMFRFCCEAAHLGSKGHPGHVELVTFAQSATGIPYLALRAGLEPDLGLGNEVEPYEVEIESAGSEVESYEVEIEAGDTEPDSDRESTQSTYVTLEVERAS